MAANRRTSRSRPSRGNNGSGEASRALAEVSQGARAAGEQVRSGLTAARQQVVEKAAEMTRNLREEIEHFADQQKGRAASKVAGVGQTMRQASRSLRQIEIGGAAEYLDGAAGMVDEVSKYLKDRELRQVVEDVEDVFRRNPAVCLGGMFAIGLLAARFLKASEEQRRPQSQARAGGRQGQGGGGGGGGGGRARAGGASKARARNRRRTTQD